MGRGSTIRDLFAYAGISFEDTHPPNWPENKPNTPFGGLPLLFITGKNGERVTLSESRTIELYLAGQFNLLGDNAYETAAISAIHSSAGDIQTNYAGVVTFNYPGAKEKCLESFKNQTLTNICTAWERHLVDNGSNGHFFGDRMSLADIRVANLLEHLDHQPFGHELMGVVEKYSNLFALKDSVANDPKLEPWRKSERWKALSKSTKGFMANAQPK
ncbi:hypothetical protein BG004_004330 [Podila humilis]|nr:hypothetical protein BG004_004330 [Podila humilis]